MSHRLAIIDDQAFAASQGIDRLLPTEAGFCHQYLHWDSSAPDKIRAFEAHLIIALAVADRMQAAKTFRSLRDWALTIPTLAIVPGGSDAEVLEVAAETADDFIMWPLREEELQRRVRRLLGGSSPDLDSVRTQLAQELSMAQLVGKDPAFVEIIRQIPLIARSEAPVLLLGETGTGKELCARALHHLSPRSNFPFIPVDCGTLPEHLAENELFGHARGAFTDARTDQKGLTGMAEGGTLFLDEVDSLSLPVQAKLLRLLEDRTYRALGADRFSKANIRVVAASNRDLDACVRARQFRHDLYFRLNVLQLRLPALRDRRADVGLLARHFLESLRQPGDHRPRALSTSSIRLLEHYDWPGNVRELFNVVQRATVLSTGPLILPGDLSIGNTVETAPAPHMTFREGRAKAVATYERSYVEEMLRKHQGNITRAAREAQKDRRAFGRLVRKHAVDPKAP